ncbi:MAG: ion channel [Polyangiales bacterium]
MPRRPVTIRLPGADYEIRVIGDRRKPLRDFYHALLRLPWSATLGTIALGFLTANALFALGFLLTGGIAHAEPGSFADAFYFSVQTMGTIGYGAMYPETGAANALVVLEAIAGLIVTALATGLVFAKFSRPTARVVFSREAVIHKMNGVPTLAIRIGNERGNRIVDLQIRCAFSRTERTAEGKTFYRTLDLELARERAHSLSRSWMILHPIDAQSPLHGATAESLAAEEAELHLMIVGLDDTSMQLVHASHIYFAPQILWQTRHADVLSETEDGSLLLDVRKFHDTEPAPD